MEFKTSKGSPTAFSTVVTQIEEGLSAPQRLDRLSKEKVVAYMTGFLPKEMSFLKSEISRLEAQESPFNRHAIEKHKLELDRHTQAFNYLENKYPGATTPPELDPRLGAYFDLKVQRACEDVVQMLSHLAIEAIENDPRKVSEFLEVLLKEIPERLARLQGWPLNEQQRYYCQVHTSTLLEQALNLRVGR